MFPGTGFPFREYREQLSDRSRDQDDYEHLYNPHLLPEDDFTRPRAPYRPTNCEYAVYVASFVAGILLTHMAQNNNVEEVLGHINAQALNILGGGMSTTSLLRWAYQECGFINRKK